MEIKDFKQLIDKDIRYSQTELKDIFEIKTKHQLNSINRKMRLDATFMLLTAAGLIALTFLLGLSSKHLISAEILGVAGVLLIHYKIKQHLINGVRLADNTILRGLEKVIARIKAYLIGYKVVIPSLISLWYIKLQYDLWLLRSGNDEFLVFLLKIAAVAIIAVLTYVIVKFLIGMLYAESLKNLTQLKDELKIDYMEQVQLIDEQR